MHDFATTLDYPARSEWVRRGLSLTADGPAPHVRARRILAASGAGRPLVLDGFSKADRYAAAIAVRLRRPAPIVMTDCTWKLGAGTADRLATRLGVRALDGPRTTFCVSSTEEEGIFPGLWGVPAERVRICRWYHGLTDGELAAPVTHDGPVFSGGRSLRDYSPLLLCAPDLGVPVTIAAAPDDLPPGVPVPANVTVGPVSHADYLDALRTASVVVVALERRHDRSAGQTTYLNAMAMGKLTVVTETVGVADHVTDGETGLIAPAGDPAGLAERIRWALDPANGEAVELIRANARTAARERFGPERHVERLLELVDEVLRR